MLKSTNLLASIPPKARSAAYKLGIIYPDLYLNINYTKRLLFDTKSHQSKIVNKKTLLTIEGFPRSGNSFMSKLVLSCNPDLTNKVGHHLHHPANIMRSVKNHIPTILMLRDPMSAIISLKSLVIFSNLKNSKNRLVPSLNKLLSLYIQYHSSLESIADKFTIVLLDDLINNQCITLSKISIAYSLDFSNVSSVKFKQHALPSNERNQIKKAVSEECVDLDSNHLDRASELYKLFADKKI